MVLFCIENCLETVAESVVRQISLIGVFPSIDISIGILLDKVYTLMVPCSFEIANLPLHLIGLESTLQ